MSLRIKRVFTWALAALMAVLFIAPAIALPAAADDGEDEELADAQQHISQLNTQYKELQKKQSAIQSQLSQTQNEKNKQLALKSQIDDQINNTIEQITLLDERIGLLNRSIAEQQEELERKEEEISDSFELLKKRMRALYMTGGNSSMLGMVLGAEDYSQIVMRAEVMTRIAQHDKDMIDELTVEMNEINAIKKSIQEDKERVESDKAEQGKKKEELDEQQAQAKDRIQDIAAMEREFLANKEELTREMQKTQAEINAIYAEINKRSQKAPYVGGDLQWPSASLYQVTSPFGTRFGGSDNHTGIDISGGGAYGSPVLAAGTGTVAVANTKYVNGYAGGYGIYVIIDHGGGVQTLYGHCSALNVTEGQVVTTGQKIAEVGSTGWSTGPHIHFEVRKDGKAQNPVSYLGG